MKVILNSLVILIATLPGLLSGCGLSGARAELLHVDGEWYFFRAWGGRDLRLKATEETRKEPDLEPGDQVQLYYTNDGCLRFITRP
jgi:hypothetical protein